MAEEKKVVELHEKDEQTSKKNIIKLGKPYQFEKKEYEEIDLSGLDKLTIQDAISAQKQLFEEQEVAAAVLCETTTAFARAIAVKATGKPVEFFKMMPRGAGRAIRQAVIAHMNVDSKTEGHYITFEKPYTFKGEVYTGVDVSAIANMTTMNESEAENRLAREGFVITETSTNYLFACVLASMATGLPEEFFTGLPLKETLKLKNAVNDSGFFE